MSFDELWRCEAVSIAAKEQLELSGEINLDILFSRAKEIYNKGYESNIHNWKSFWIGGKQEEEKPAKKVKKKKAKKGFKICPECGEQVPESWTKHTYKKDGKKCGYDFGG